MSSNQSRLARHLTARSSSLGGKNKNELTLSLQKSGVMAVRLRLKFTEIRGGDKGGESMKAAEQRNLQPEATSHSSEGGQGAQKTSFYSLLPEFSCCLSSSTLSARPSISAARPDPPAAGTAFPKNVVEGCWPERAGPLSQVAPLSHTHTQCVLTARCGSVFIH